MAYRKDVEHSTKPSLSEEFFSIAQFETGIARKEFEEEKKTSGENFSHLEAYTLHLIAVFENLECKNSLKRVLCLALLVVKP